MEQSSAELDAFLLGLIDYLRHHRDVHAVRASAGEPAPVRDIRQWEQKHSMKLPTDVQLFYQTFNGFSIEWDVQIKDLPVPLGRIAIAPVLSLSKVPNEQCKKMVEGLSDGPECSVFVLDTSQQFGTVYIVISTKSEGEYTICYLPPPPPPAATAGGGGGVLLHVASSLQAYLRLALVHLGLQQWQQKVATGQVACHLRMWYSLFIPSPSHAPSFTSPTEAKDSCPSTNHITNILDERMLLTLWQGTTKTADTKQEQQALGVKKPSK